MRPPNVGQAAPLGDDQVVGLALPAAKRIGEATRYVETHLRRKTPARFALNTTGGIVLAVAKGDIPSGSVPRPGKGRATLYAIDDSDLGVSLEEDVDVYNIFDKTIKGGAGLELGSRGGKLVVVGVDSCSNLGNPSTGAELSFLPPDRGDGQNITFAEPASIRLARLGDGGVTLESPVGTATPSLVQSAQAVNTTSGFTVTFGAGTTAGSLVVVKIAYASTSGSITLSGYTSDVTGSNGTILGAIYSKPNVSAGTTTVSGTFSGGTPRWVVVAEEWANLKVSSAVDQTASATATGSATVASGTTAATSQASEMAAVLLIADATGGGVGTSTDWSSPTNGYTLSRQNNNNVGLGAATLYKVLSGTGAQSTAATNSQSPNSLGLIATYKST